MNKKTYLFIGITTFIGVIFSLFTMHQGIVLSLLNTFFIIGLLYFLIGGTLLVIESGFFNLTRYGFKKLRRSSKEQEVIEQFTENEKEQVDNDILFQQIRFSSTKLFLTIGIVLAVTTTIGSFLYM